MKRFHVHLHTQDLPASVSFYAGLFGQPPTRQESDYAKWMLDDPPLNFALSARGGAPGVSHLGMQVDGEDELDALRARADAAQGDLFDEGRTTCCYARSDKHWVSDPQGVRWEHFRTFDASTTFAGAASAAAPARSACCGPAR